MGGQVMASLVVTSVAAVAAAALWTYQAKTTKEPAAPAPPAPAAPASANPVQDDSKVDSQKAQVKQKFAHLIDDELTVVERSCRVTAGFRAAEVALAEDSLLASDGLASILAGPYGTALGEEAVKIYTEREGPGKHSYGAARARILDDRLTAALVALASSTSDRSAPLQVVSLGAGMCTRPWRLQNIPSHCIWYEVDQAPVLTLKQQLLRNARAQTSVSHVQHADTSGASNALTGMAYTFPLYCGGYHAVPVDFSTETLTDRLIASGFQTGAPTLFVGEGLIYYIELSAVEDLLRQAAQLAAPGSVFMATTISKELLEYNKKMSAGHSRYHNCVDDLTQPGFLSSLRWGPPDVTADWSVVLREEYGKEAYNPYANSQMANMKSVECLLTTVLQA